MKYTYVFQKSRIQALERDDFTCQRCSIKDDLQVHHVIPLRIGGSDKVTNLKTFCKSCHVIEESKIRPPVESIPRKMSGSMWSIHCNVCEFVWWSSYYPKSCQRCKSVNWDKAVILNSKYLLEI